MSVKNVWFIALLLLLTSCQFFKSTDDREPVARVNNSFLYKEDVADLVLDDMSKADSAVIVTAYINKWATQILLLEGAERNLQEDKQQDFNKLVDQYKTDLYTKAYLEALVKQSVDTVINENEAKEVFEENKASFKLNDELIKFRYISFSENAINKDGFVERFKRFDNEDKTYLDSIAVQFKSYSLNDSIWIRASNVIEKLPIFNSDNKEELLKKTNFIQRKDSLDIYLVQVKEVKLKNDLAPLEFVRPTINQIIINKRKLELTKKFEKDITTDAIKNKQFEIYN
ncbi:MAG: peptidyl-prolyl cis-trans isomerase [Bacteroidota bacterium]